MTEGFDSAGPDAVAPDSSPAPEVTVGEVARLTQYAGTQERKISELEITVGHLRHALQARIVIDRAIGMLAERFDLSIADAFELLRAAARDSRREMRALATELTESREKTPHEIAEAARRRHR